MIPLWLRNLAARVCGRPDWEMMTQAEHDAALAELEAQHQRQMAELTGLEEAARETVVASRARLAAVMALPESEGRSRQAFFLAAETPLSIAEIASALAASAAPRLSPGDLVAPAFGHDWRGNA